MEVAAACFLAACVVATVIIIKMVYIATRPDDEPKQGEPWEDLPLPTELPEWPDLREGRK